MGFSGIRAVLMGAILVVLLVAITKFDLPGWILPVGLILSAVVLRSSEEQASN